MMALFRVWVDKKSAGQKQRGGGFGRGITCTMPMIMPNSPIALANISMIRILTKSTGFAASASAAPEPTIPGNFENSVTNKNIAIVSKTNSVNIAEKEKFWPYF